MVSGRNAAPKQPHDPPGDSAGQVPGELCRDEGSPGSPTYPQRVSDPPVCRPTLPVPSALQSPSIITAGSQHPLLFLPASESER